MTDFAELYREKIPTFQVMGFLGLRYAPATRARTDRRQISAVLWSQTLRFECVVRDGAFSARADIQPVPRGLTPRPCYAPKQDARARCVLKRENDVSAVLKNYATVLLCYFV